MTHGSISSVSIPCAGLPPEDSEAPGVWISAGANGVPGEEGPRLTSGLCGDCDLILVIATDVDLDPPLLTVGWDGDVARLS